MNKRLAKLKNIQEANINFLKRNTKKSLNEGKFDDDDEFLNNDFSRNIKLKTDDIITKKDNYSNDDEFLNNDFYGNKKLKTDDIITKKDNDSDTFEGIVFTIKPKSDVSLNMLSSSAFQGMSALEAKENEPFLLPRLFNYMGTDEFKRMLDLTPEEFDKKTFVEKINKQKKEWIDLVNQKNEVGVIQYYDKICMYPSNSSSDINELIKNIFDEVKVFKRQFKPKTYLKLPNGGYPLMQTYKIKRAPIKNFYLENPSWVDPNETIQSLKTYIKTDKKISDIIKNITLLV